MISEDHARLFERDGATPVVLQQWRSFEAAKHDAVAPVQGNFAKHLRRRTPAAKTARVIRASHQLTRRGVLVLNSFTT